jgi:hypothetical protein
MPDEATGLGLRRSPQTDELSYLIRFFDFRHAKFQLGCKLTFAPSAFNPKMLKTEVAYPSPRADAGSVGCWSAIDLRSC